MKTFLLICQILIIAHLSTAQVTIFDAQYFIIGEDSVPTETSIDTIFYWNQNSRALRVGVYKEGMLNEIQLGINSTSFGANNQVGGYAATAYGTDNLVQGSSSMGWGRLNKNYGGQGTVWGFNNEARNNYTTVFGTGNDARLTASTAWGQNNLVEGNSATGWGSNNIVIADNATVFGLGNNSASTSSLTIGEYSKPFDIISPMPPDSADFLFVIGNGVDNNTPSNAMIVNRSGQVGIGVDIPDEALHVNGNIYAAGTITQMSDVNSKYDFKEIENDEILEKISSLPITNWKYKGTSETHIGPMAQDFYAAFGLGGSETTIATVDADGVALAAIKALIEKVNELEKSNKTLELKLQNLK